MSPSVTMLTKNDKGEVWGSFSDTVIFVLDVHLFLDDPNFKGCELM